MTEDAIRRSKLFLDLETNLKNQIKQQKEEFENELNAVKNTYEGEKVFSSVNKNAMKILLGGLAVSSATVNLLQKIYLIKA